MTIQGIKTNIALYIAILLIVAMFLIDFIMIITAQHGLIKSEISKANLILSEVENHISIDEDRKNLFIEPAYSERLEKILKEAGFSCLLVQDKNSNILYSGGLNSLLSDEIRNITKQSVKSLNKTIRHIGTTWGVLWMQDRYLMISVPLLVNGEVEAGAGIVIELENIYSVIRRSQKVLIIYLMINAFVLTLIGLHFVSKIAVKPVQQMLQRADGFRDEDGFFFLHDNKDNEFNKLSKALNRLLKRISEDKEKLQDNVQSLEKMNADLKKAEKDVIRAEKLASVGRLSSGIAHEIGNPIGIVLGYLGLLKQDDISDCDKFEYIERAESEINRINIIIRQLLDFSRPSEVKNSKTGVHEAIQEIAEIVKYQPFMSGIELKISLDAKNDNVLSDSNQLSQIFLNLVINAADAISSSKDKVKGQCLIKTENINSADAKAINNMPSIKVSVVDNGSGISEDSIGNIFDPFFTTKESGKGTGLGLFVCFSIIEGMGGKIEAKSSNKEEGATISIYLPLCEEIKQ
ncbi:MAG: hypothetical protein KJ826_01280 [Proteobacteria bacterium]|nr:hypothetical protein [Pseudomonadota bacterium]